MIANNAAYFNFNPVTFTGDFPAGWYGSCTIDAGTANVVAFVQMRYTGNSNAAAYEAMPINGTHRNLVFPLIQKRLGDGQGTVVTVQNLSQTANANIAYWYFDTNGNVSVSGGCTLGPRQSFMHNHRLDPVATENCPMNNLPNGWTGSLVVSSNNQAIDGFVQLTNVNNPAGDTFMAHNALK